MDNKDIEKPSNHDNNIITAEQELEEEDIILVVD